MILLEGEGHIFIAAEGPLAKAQSKPEARRIRKAAADTFLGASFYRSGRKVGQVVGFVSEWPYPLSQVQKAAGIAPGTAYMDIALSAYGEQLHKSGRWDACFNSMEVRPLGGVRKAEKLRKALARVYSGNDTSYHAPLVSPDDGAQLTAYNSPWDNDVRGYGPTGVPDVALMDPLASVVDMATLYQQHGPVQFHQAARMLPHHHLMQAAGHAAELGHPVQHALLAAAADCAHKPLPALHTGALDPSGPANRPVVSADAGEMVEGIDLTSPNYITPQNYRYGLKPLKKDAVSPEMNAWLDETNAWLDAQADKPVEKGLKRKHKPLLDTAGVDPKSPRDLNVVHANYSQPGAEHVVAKLKPSEAASLACNPTVHPAVRRILARRGRNAGDVKAVFGGTG